MYWTIDIKIFFNIKDTFKVLNSFTFSVYLANFHIILYALAVCRNFAWIIIHSLMIVTCPICWPRIFTWETTLQYFLQIFANTCNFDPTFCAIPQWQFYFFWNSILLHFLYWTHFRYFGRFKELTDDCSVWTAHYGNIYVRELRLLYWTLQKFLF